MHGDADCLVPYNQAMSLRDALTAQGVEATLITMAGKGHGLVIYQFPAARDQIEAFLDQHLK
jgi:acetyl esterase/lipase